MSHSAGVYSQRIRMGRPDIAFYCTGINGARVTTNSTDYITTTVYGFLWVGGRSHETSGLGFWSESGVDGKRVRDDDFRHRYMFMILGKIKLMTTTTTCLHLYIYGHYYIHLYIILIWVYVCLYLHVSIRIRNHKRLFLFCCYSFQIAVPASRAEEPPLRVRPRASFPGHSSIICAFSFVRS